MPIPFACPHCGNTTMVGDQYAGQTGPCARCGQMVTIPGGMPAMVLPASAPSKSWPVVIIVLLVIGALSIPCLGIMVGLLLPAVNRGREQGRRMTCANNVRNIALAMLTYEQKHGKFPPSYEMRNGHAVSWRILVLPELGHQTLYDQYDFDEPWDGPNNAKLAGLMPVEYRCPSEDADTEGPNYFLITGPGAITNGEKSVSSGRIRDGLANTILVVEAANTGLHWMEPGDLDLTDLADAFDPNAGTSLSSYHSEGANVAMADGSVVFLPDTTDQKTLQAMVSIAGGEAAKAP